MSLVCCLHTKPGKIFIHHGTITTLSRWRRQHTFLPNPATSWKVALDFLQRWEIYLERRVQAKGWDGQLLRRALRRLPRSVSQAHRWFLLKAHFNAPIASARLAAARVVDEHLQCCLCSCKSDSLDHLPRCQTVLDVYGSMRVVASLHSML